MDLCENLLVTASEECAEIQQSISKALRFGLTSGSEYPPNFKSNQDQIMQEYLELTAVIERLQVFGWLPIPSIEDKRYIKLQKLDKVTKYCDVSRANGCLND